MTSKHLPISSKNPEQEELEATKAQFDQLELEYAAQQLEYTTLLQDFFVP